MTVFTDLFIIRAYPRNPRSISCQLTPRAQTGAGTAHQNTAGARAGFQGRPPLVYGARNFNLNMFILNFNH